LLGWWFLVCSCERANERGDRDPNAVADRCEHNQANKDEKIPHRSGIASERNKADRR
jgi:hypothetical protein